MIETNTYIRKPLYVKGIQVTEANFAELALWCQGEIVDTSVSGGKQERHIQVRVTNPMNPRQAQARVGDWILTSDRGYKIYTPKAFARAFDMVEDASPGPGARALFENDAPPVEVVEDPAEVAATLHQEAKAGRMTAEEADAGIVATAAEPVTPGLAMGPTALGENVVITHTVNAPNLPVGSGPMPPQPEPTDVEVQHVPAVPENLKDDANIVYPERPRHVDKTMIEELPDEELQQIDEELQELRDRD